MQVSSGSPASRPSDRRARRARAAWVVAGLVALALGGWWVQPWLNGSDAPARSHAPSPRSTGSPEAGPPTLARREAGAPRGPGVPEPGRTSSLPVPGGELALSGVVLDPDGLALEGALIYRLPKGVRGARALPRAWWTESDAQGRFRLRVDPGGAWIGASAEGLHHTLADGDTLPRESPLTLQLGRADVAEVRVRVRDALTGAPVAAVVQASAGGDQDGDGDPDDFAYPGPGGQGRAYALGETDPATGEALLDLTSQGPVRVQATSGLSPIEPREVRLRGPGGNAEFRRVARCSIRLRVLDEPSGSPVDGTVTVAVSDAGTGTHVNGFSFRTRTGEVTLDDRLGPGLYDLRVQATDHKERWLRGVRLAEPGAPVDLTVRLEPGRAKGTLKLAVVPDPEREPRQGRVIPLWMWRRVEGHGWTTEGFLGAKFSIEAQGRLLVWRDVEPGAYDVLVWSGASATVGLVRGVRVEADREAATRVQLAEGLTVRLAEVVGPARDLARVQVREADLGDLPLLRLEGLGFGTYSDGWPPDPWAVLGPYPAQRLSVEVVPLMGEPIHAVVTR